MDWIDYCRLAALAYVGVGLAFTAAAIHQFSSGGVSEETRQKGFTEYDKAIAMGGRWFADAVILVMMAAMILGWPLAIYQQVRDG